MPSIRLAVQASKETLYPGNGKRVRKHTARVGALSYSAETEVEAREGLEKLVGAALDVENAVIVMYDLVDPTTVWIALGDAHGWHYRIYRPMAAGLTHYSRDSACMGGWTREECRDRMMAHWYQQNVEPIVDGICSLAGWGRYVCGACRTATTLTRERVCQNPACRKPL